MKVWEKMTREEIKLAAELDSVVVVTVGATEQHGPHLPVDVDNKIILSVAEASVRKASASLPVVLGPHLPFGYSPHHFLYAGVISLSVETMVKVLQEVVESIMKSGFQKIFLLNSHGGNSEIIRLAMKDLHESYPSHYIGAASYWEIAKESLDKFKEDYHVFDVGHAGQFETSLMMAIDEGMVDMTSIKETIRDDSTILNFPSYLVLTPENKWEIMDGYSDSPSLARKEIGEKLLRIISDEISHALQLFFKQ